MTMLTSLVDTFRPKEAGALDRFSLLQASCQYPYLWLLFRSLLWIVNALFVGFAYSAGAPSCHRRVTRDMLYATEGVVLTRKKKQRHEEHPKSRWSSHIFPTLKVDHHGAFCSELQAQ